VKRDLCHPQNHNSDLYKQLNSKFYSFLYKGTSIKEIKLYLNKLKEKYPDASHICYAYRLFDGFTILDGINISEYSADAGEPRGSAGPPILKTLKKFNLINTVIFVVRYFGGKKLGIPGLIEAYSNSSEAVINSKELVDWYPITTIELNYPYNLDSLIKNLINNFDAKIKKQLFQDSILSIIELDYFKMNDFIDKASSYSDLKLQIIKN
jgi:uncharacterized YigZ family protein